MSEAPLYFSVKKVLGHGARVGITCTAVQGYPLIENKPSLGPYSRLMPRVLGRS